MTKLRFVHPYFTYSLRYAKLARVNITYAQNPNLDDFNEIFFCGWEPIIGHADHDGGIRLARFGPIAEKQRDKVRWILGEIDLNVLLV